MTKIYLIY